MLEFSGDKFNRSNIDYSFWSHNTTPTAALTFRGVANRALLIVTGAFSVSVADWLNRESRPPGNRVMLHVWRQCKHEEQKVRFWNSELFVTIVKAGLLLGL